MGVVPNIRTSQAVLLYTGNFLLWQFYLI
jgi:hypothetical protein